MISCGLIQISTTFTVFRVFSRKYAFLQCDISKVNPLLNKLWSKISNVKLGITISLMVFDKMIHGKQISNIWLKLKPIKDSCKQWHFIAIYWAYVLKESQEHFWYQVKPESINECTNIWSNNFEILLYPRAKICHKWIELFDICLYIASGCTLILHMHVQQTFLTQYSCLQHTLNLLVLLLTFSVKKIGIIRLIEISIFGCG